MKQASNIAGLIPLGVFILVYVAGSLVAGGFYKIPIHIAFLISAFCAVAMSRGLSLNNRIKAFTQGMGNANIMLMCLIFLLSGMFSELCKDLGAISVIVDLSLTVMPSASLLAGLFIISCLLSLSVGTSVGTINVLAPIAVGLAAKTDFSLALILASVVSGAMFGDNLAMISDTTVVAVRTQGCSLKEKFKTNLKIVWAPALLTVVIYIILSTRIQSTDTLNVANLEAIKLWPRALPYAAVLILALAGINVIVVLTAGCIMAIALGLAFTDFSILSSFQSASRGFENMALLAVVCMIIGGVMQLVKINGGIKFLTQAISRKISSKMGAELGIAILIVVIDLCTANNTIAILLAGDITKSIAGTYKIGAARAASLLDTFSCFAQGIIPYGAQILTAVALTNFTISPLELMKYQYYTFLVGIFSIASILIPQRQSSHQG